MTAAGNIAAAFVQPPGRFQGVHGDPRRAIRASHWLWPAFFASLRNERPSPIDGQSTRTRPSIEYKTFSRLPVSQLGHPHQGIGNQAAGQHHLADIEMVDERFRAAMISV